MSEIQGKNIVFVLREQANILSANGRGGEYLDHAADKIESYEDRIAELEADVKEKDKLIESNALRIKELNFLINRRQYR